MTTYTVSHQAYVKIFLHAAKYPHASVNGVLLGKNGGNGDSTSVVIEDAIPLLHMWTSLSPMMEIGLELAFNYAESLGLKLVGYYQAAERLDDTTLAPVGEKVASKIKDQFSDAIALVVDGTKINTREFAFVPYISSGTLWRTNPPGGSTVLLENPKSPSRVLSLIRDKALHQRFGDFDDHLEDVTVDWLTNTPCVDASFS